MIQLVCSASESHHPHLLFCIYVCPRWLDRLPLTNSSRYRLLFELCRTAAEMQHGKEQITRMYSMMPWLGVALFLYRLSLVFSLACRRAVTTRSQR